MKILITFALLLVSTLTTHASDLFSAIDPLHFTLTAPFEQLFSQRLPENPPPNFVQKPVNGLLTYIDSRGTTITLHPQVKIRGRSSQEISECQFPKITLMFSVDEIRGTIFENDPKLDVGTHCSTQGGFSYLGRNWDGKTPHREVLVYEILKILKVPTYRARAAWFNYTEQTTGQSIGVNFQAMLLEDSSILLQRYNAIKASSPYVSLADSPGVTIEDVARIYFAETLLGNWDWALTIEANNQSTINKFWNMKLVQLPNQNFLIYPYDFDLADLVTNRLHVLEKSLLIPTLFPHDLRVQMGNEIRSHEKEIRQLSQRLVNDSEGQAFFKKQFDLFYTNLPTLTK